MTVQITFYRLIITAWPRDQQPLLVMKNSANKPIIDRWIHYGMSEGPL